MPNGYSAFYYAFVGPVTQWASIICVVSGSDKLRWRPLTDSRSKKIESLRGIRALRHSRPFVLLDAENTSIAVKFDFLCLEAEIIFLYLIRLMAAIFDLSLPLTMYITKTSSIVSQSPQTRENSIKISYFPFITSTS